jgi:alpha-L-fucosidase
MRMSIKNLPKPTAAQYRWQDMELGIFCHFGINTFCNQEWGDGSDLPEKFNPLSLDARQWVRLAKECGFKYFILTAKHHDGFCLWPTKTTDYSVASSPWKDGKGDVVLECAEACREEGVGFGVYLSPWDRHEPCYPDKKAYDDFYAEQLTELLTNYGPLVEVWFDGAGSEGREYDWARITGLVKKYQPDAMIFNLGAPTIRWVGNEDGAAPYPCWNAAKEARVSMFTDDMLTWLPETPDWVPAECDVSIRRGKWFWHPDDEESLLSLKELKDIYYRSVGHGTNLLLNVPPDNRGLIPEADAARLREFAEWIRDTFSSPLYETSGSGEELEIAFESPEFIDHVVLMEEIAEGERVREYILEAKKDNRWVEVVRGSAIGHKKIDRLEPVSCSGIRLKILKAVATPVIRKLSVYAANGRF